MHRSEILCILKDFKNNHAAEYGINKIGVFGSVARDQATEQSDVDIVVKTETPDPFNIVHIKDDLENLTGHHVDIIRLRTNMNTFLLKRIEKEAVYV